MFRSLRALLSYSRVPVRIAAHPAPRRLYRVRFVPQDKRLNAFLRVFLIVSGMQIAANSVLQIFGGGWEEPIFIPFGFARKEPLRRYEVSDPDFQAFVRFNQDKKRVTAARAKVLETLVQRLEKNNKSKFGGNVKAQASILYYHYPIGPPQEYTRSGLLITPAPRDPSHPLRLSTLSYTWVSRPIPAPIMHRLNSALYPSWVLNSLYSSLLDTFTWLSAGQSMDPVALGGAAVMKGLIDVHQKLRRSWKPPPPPKGHVIIDGIVQVGGNDLIVGIDVTASFNPETLGEWRFHRTEVRFAGKVKKRAKMEGMLDSEGVEKMVEQTRQTLKAAEELQRRVERMRVEEQRREEERRVEEQKEVMETKVGMERGDAVEEKIGVEQKVKEERPSVGILGEKGEPVAEGEVKRAGGEKQKADVDDAASSKT